MNEEKIEGFLIGIGVGIVVAAFLRTNQQSRKTPVNAPIGDRPRQEAGREGAPEQPPNQSVRASHA